MSGVFINYRRDDAKSEAGRLFDWLSRYFGKDQVFMDVSGSIEPGLEFDRVIEKAVSSCDVLIVVIGKAWLTALDEKGKRRLEDPNDFVRMEVAAALRRDIRVIPVLVQGAVMPEEGSLPEDLKRLSKRQASEISDNRWEFDTEQLVKVLEKVGGKAARHGQTVVPDERPAPMPTPSVTKKFSGKAIAGMVLAGVVTLAVISNLPTTTPTSTPEPEPTMPPDSPPTTPVAPATPSTPADSVIADPGPPVQEPPAPSFIDISGSWRGPDGIYIFQQSGNNIAFQLFGWNQLLIAQGTGTIQQGVVTITYVRADNTGGDAGFQVSANGREMTGRYRNFVTGEIGPVVLVR